MRALETLISQTVVPVDSGILGMKLLPDGPVIPLINQHFGSPIEMSDLFSVYASWDGRGESLQTFPTFCRALLVPGERIGRPQYTFKLKGIGLVKGSFPYGRMNDKHPLVVDVSDNESRNIWALGCCSHRHVLHEWEVTELFRQEGVDTHVNSVGLGLNEIVDESGSHRRSYRFLKYHLRSAKRGLRYPETFSPCIYVSAHTNIIRLDLAWDEDIADFCQKNNIDDYVHFLVRKTAVQLARIHDIGLLHTAYTETNIQIDGSITDNEGVLGIDLNLPLDNRYIISNLFPDKINASYMREMGCALETVGFIVLRFSDAADEKQIRDMKDEFLHIYFDNKKGSFFSDYSYKRLREYFSVAPILGQ